MKSTMNFRTTTTALYDSDDDESDDEFDGPSRRIGAFLPMNPTLLNSSSSAPSMSPMMMPAPITAPKMSTTSVAPVEEEVDNSWKVSAVPTLPLNLTLEQTAVFIPNAASNPSIVSSRISKALEQQCAEVYFENETAQANCYTSDFAVEFCVNLFQGRNEYSHGIIVEVQRLSGGMSLSFNNAQAILDAAKGRLSTPLPPAFGSSIPMALDDDDYQSNAASSLDMIAGMARMPHSQLLAFQMLSSMTDPTKMGSATAAATSRELLHGADTTVLQALYQCIITAPNNNNSNKQVKFLALQSLANALSHEPQPLTVNRDIIVLLQQQQQQGLSIAAGKCLQYLVAAAH